MLKCQTSAFYFFQHIVKIYLNTYWHTPVRPSKRRCIKTTHRPGLFSSTTLSRSQANFLDQTCIAGLVKHLSPYTGRISEWMVFGQSLFPQRKWITEQCSLRDDGMMPTAVASPYLSLTDDVTVWVIVIKLTAVIQNYIAYKTYISDFSYFEN